MSKIASGSENVIMLSNEKHKLLGFEKKNFTLKQPISDRKRETENDKSEESGQSVEL